MKQCPKCNQPGEFYRNRSRPDGLSYWCKQCMRRSQPAAKHARLEQLRQTAHGKAGSVWNGICQRAGNTDGRHPTYAGVELRMTREAFMTWAVPRYAAWLRDHPDVPPSIDRKRLAGHYEISNLQIISLSDNSRWSGAHKNVLAPPGKAWCAFCCCYYARDNFYRNSRAPHGLQFLCKRCSSQANIASRARRKSLTERRTA